MKEKINSLLRTNTALILLCIISVAVLAILVRERDDGVVRVGDNAPAIIPAIQSPVSSGSAPARTTLLRDMPDQATYQSFVYEMGKDISVSGICQDVYRVLLIFPKDIDYRRDPMSARYNTATACTLGKPYSETVSLESSRLQPGAEYYYIQAAEGERGAWYGPY